jgi:hypothetical protein
LCRFWCRFCRNWWLQIGRIGRTYRRIGRTYRTHRNYRARLFPCRTVRPAPSLLRRGGDGWPGRGPALALGRQCRPPGGAICCLGQKLRHGYDDVGGVEGSKRPSGPKAPWGSA